jgi:hypothetical protein
MERISKLSGCLRVDDGDDKYVLFNRVCIMDAAEAEAALGVGGA